MGNIEVGNSEVTLLALGIGSCLVITFYDPQKRIGALAHTMLAARRLSPEARLPAADRRRENRGSPDTRYADIAIEEMLKRIEALGARRANIEAKLIGGANMFSAFASDIAENNISCTRKKLQKEGIAIVGECLGGSQGRSVDFAVASGIVTVKTKF